MVVLFNKSPKLIGVGFSKKGENSQEPAIC